MSQAEAKGSDTTGNADASAEGARGSEEETGMHEQKEPGKPTREMDPEVGAKGGAGADTNDVEAIASQQGATQRGYTDDRKEKEDRPAQFDPAHPGGRPEGDPRR
jgi:hypothetical protein